MKEREKKEDRKKGKKTERENVGERSNVQSKQFIRNISVTCSDLKTVSHKQREKKKRRRKGQMRRKKEEKRRDGKRREEKRQKKKRRDGKRREGKDTNSTLIFLSRGLLPIREGLTLTSRRCGLSRESSITSQPKSSQQFVRQLAAVCEQKEIGR